MVAVSPYEARDFNDRPLQSQARLQSNKSQLISMSASHEGSLTKKQSKGQLLPKIDDSSYSNFVALSSNKQQNEDILGQSVNQRSSSSIQLPEIRIRQNAGRSLNQAVKQVDRAGLRREAKDNKQESKSTKRYADEGRNDQHKDQPDIPAAGQNSS